MKKLIVFFDIDGVFNYTDWYICDRNPGTLYGQEGEIDPWIVEEFNKLWKYTGAEFVMSSDWREDFDAACKRLRNVGAEFPISGFTPMHKFDMTRANKMRGDEIQHWIDDNIDDLENFNYVIIDDRTDFRRNQKKHFVHINPKVGFSFDDFDKCLKILRDE
jgi:hypothetical protein